MVGNKNENRPPLTRDFRDRLGVMWAVFRGRSVIFNMTVVGGTVYFRTPGGRAHYCTFDSATLDDARRYYVVPDGSFAAHNVQGGWCPEHNQPPNDCFELHHIKPNTTCKVCRHEHIGKFACRVKVGPLECKCIGPIEERRANLVNRT